jgi:hypothetical protein
MLRFLGIGAQKAGTTWLYEMLVRHPEVRFAAFKELHYWNNPEREPLERYRAKFDGAEAFGDITPAYQFLPVATIREIRAAFPDVRLVFIIRNPIDRAWSSAKMALQRAELDLAEASDPWFIDHFRSAGSRSRGDYETAIRNWRSVFPSEQLAIHRYEELARAPNGLLVRVARHIGVDGGFFESLSTTITQKRVFASPVGELRPTLRPVLDDLYREQILSLQDYLGEDLGSWLEEPTARAIAIA